MRAALDGKQSPRRNLRGGSCPNDRSTLVDISPVSDLEDDNDQSTLFNAVENAIGPHSDPKDVCVALEFSRTPGPGICGEGQHGVWSSPGFVDT